MFTNERVLNEVYIPTMNYKYYFLQIADYDVRMIVPFEDKQSRSLLQSERMGIIRWGSQCSLILPYSERWDFEFIQEPLMHVRAGSDPLFKIIKKSQTKKFYVLQDEHGLMRNVKQQLHRGKRITIEEESMIPKFVIEDKEGIKIVEVDGTYIRDNIDIDFTAGGHEFVYPNYIRPGEVWIDKDMSPQDKEATVIHELNERMKMSKGMMYEEAHDNSSRLEKKIRKDNPVTDSDDNIEIPAEYMYLFKHGNEDMKKRIKDSLKNIHK
jgi:hypothetical protein